MQAARILGLLSLLLVPASVATIIHVGWAQNSDSAFRPAIPKTWNDPAIATLDVPLANPIGSPKHVSADYYYRILVRPIYKQYPIYAPGGGDHRVGTAEQSLTERTARSLRFRRA